jgi:hypothetical protein
VCGFIVPKSWSRAESLIEASVRFGCSGDGEMAVADAGHLHRRGREAGAGIAFLCVPALWQVMVLLCAMATDGATTPAAI